MSTNAKIAIGVIYSLIASCLVMVLVVMRPYYYASLVGGDFGFLSVLMGWAFLPVAFVPALIIYKLTSKHPEGAKKKRARKLLLLPFVVGFIILILLTFTRRLLFQPIYKYKEHSIQRNVQLRPNYIQYKGYVYEENCRCTRPRVEGGIEIDNEVGFPLTLQIYPNYSGGGCSVSGLFTYRLDKGKQNILFSCFFNENGNVKFNFDSLNYTFSITEEGNEKVQVDKIFSNNAFEKLP